MKHIKQLIDNYSSFVKLPWSTNISGCQRVWFAVYPPAEERRLRAHIPEFDYATRDARHEWHLIDITHVSSKFISNHKYRESYFEDPDAIASIDEDLKDDIISFLKKELTSSETDANTVIAVIGTGSLFGFTHISPILASIDSYIEGRLLIFFPGVYEKNMYRFMDAREGFDYMAIPITCDEGIIL